MTTQDNDRRNRAPHRPETIAASSGVATDTAHGAISPPIYLSTSYEWATPDEKPRYDYSRSNNPTRDLLAEAIAELEGGKRGIVTASGMAAVDLPMNLVGPGELIVAPHDLYGGSHRLLAARARRGDFRVSFIDQTDDAAFAKAMAEGPKLVLLETPSNPLLRITDLADRIAKAKAVGALTVADNTFLSPVLQNPIEFGCDIVLHSTTKYLNGHSDVIGGVVVCADEAMGEDLAWWANCTGVTGAGFDSWLTLRGLRTLFVRMRQQQESAEAIARTFAGRDDVDAVYWPGLEAHVGHDIAKRQQKGFGAMLSIAFAPDVDVRRVLQGLELFTSGPSLGGYESLTCIPAIMTHAGMPKEDRETAGLTDTLMRFSIGLEATEDLIADLEGALAQAR